MLAHYQLLGLIDTGAYDLRDLIPHVREIAATLNLELRIFQGTLERLKDCVSGAWNEKDYGIIPPFTTIELPHLGLDALAPVLQGPL